MPAAAEICWAEDQVADLARYWRQGLSATQIARRLNKLYDRTFTRNSVIGKVHRLGLNGRATPSRPVQRNPKRKAPRPPELRVVEKIATQAMPVFAPHIDAPESKKIPLTQLKDHHCRWSTHEEGEHLFCGHDREDGKPYCAYHAKKAVTKDSEKKMRGAQRVVEHYVRQERRAA